MNRYKWEPGNGSSYDLLLGKVDEFVRMDPDQHQVLYPAQGEQLEGRSHFHEASIWVLCWLRNSGSGGTCVAFSPDSYLADSYLSEKLDTNEADTRAISQFLKSNGFDTDWSDS